MVALIAEKPIVDDVPSCRNVTNVTSTVVPLSPMIAVSCMKLTEPLTLETRPRRVLPRIKTFPHPALNRTRHTTRRADRRCFKGHRRWQLESLHPGGGS